MTKKDFENYREPTAICSSCGHIIDVCFIYYRNLRHDGTLSRCPVCDWKHRNGWVPGVDGFSSEQVEYALEFVILQKSTFVNDLATELNIELIDALKLIRSLKIGNKSFRVKCTCDFCGKEIEKPSNVYNSNVHNYCSKECYWKHKPLTVQRGKDSPFYNRIYTQCTNCRKDMMIEPFRNVTTNGFGDNHNFCSNMCYWEYRGKYYSGDRSPRFGVKFTPERKERFREIMVQNSRSGKRFDSKIQLLVNDVLDKNDISYKREHIIKYFAIDNFLDEYNLIIEVMGDYWHSSPLKYNEHKYGINEMQRRSLHHDKLKHSYIKSHLGIEILYLWEKDIEKNIELCEQLIFEYIKNNGILPNYHSFNYHVESGSLMLNDTAIVPYQEQDISAYRHLFKEKVG